MSAKTGDQSVIAITSESIDSEKKVSVNGANDSLKDFNSMDIKLSPSPTDEYMGVQESGASLFSSIVNVMNTIIGARTIYPFNCWHVGTCWIVPYSCHFSLSFFRRCKNA